MSHFHLKLLETYSDVRLNKQIVRYMLTLRNLTLSHAFGSFNPKWLVTVHWKLCNRSEFVLLGNQTPNTTLHYTPNELKRFCVLMNSLQSNYFNFENFFKSCFSDWTLCSHWLMSRLVPWHKSIDAPSCLTCFHWLEHEWQTFNFLLMLCHGLCCPVKSCNCCRNMISSRKRLNTNNALRVDVWSAVMFMRVSGL